MIKIIVFNLISLDGHFAGQNGDISWHNVDAEFNEFAIEQLSQAGLLMFGRVTYQLMASYWTSANALKDDPVVAKEMNTKNKVVFSRTLAESPWQNTRLIKEININEINKLKQAAEKDIYIFGSGQIVQEFTRLKLVDEYRLMVNPVILGAGKPLFNQALKLKLLQTRQFKNGNVLLCYSPAAV